MLITHGEGGFCLSLYIGSRKGKYFDLYSPANCLAAVRLLADVRFDPAVIK